MIEINLLPEELKRRKRATSKINVTNISLEKISFIKIALIVVGIVVGIQIALFGFGIVGRIILRTLEKNYKQILPEKKEAEQLKLQISHMSKKVSAIDELMVKRFSWAKKLGDLNDSVTSGIWLTQLDYDERIVEKSKAASNVSKGHEGKVAIEKVLEKHLIISGAASSMGEEGTALIGHFIKSLKENASFYSDFSDIELGNIKREQMGGQEIMIFKITCLFKIK